MAKKIYDLEKISISLDVYGTWKNHVTKKVIEWYQKTGRLKNIKLSEIPDEQFRVLENGDGEIFLKMPDGVEITLSVPKEHWVWSSTIQN